MKLDLRYIPPVLISLILIAAHLSFGILRSYESILLAIGVSMAVELVLGRLYWGTWRHLASAYTSGISVGILVRSPMLWPFALCSAISIASKYVLRVRGRHIWNPSNFGICALFFLAPFAVAPLNTQWGNNMWPMLVIWIIGLITIWRAKRAHITLTYIASFFLFAFARSVLTGDGFWAEVAPITGPMYQLFALFMITDPKTTVSSKTGEMVVAFIVAFVELFLRLGEVVYAPFYALFIVGPIAMLIEMWWTSEEETDDEHEAASEDAPAVESAT